VLVLATPGGAPEPAAAGTPGALVLVGVPLGAATAVAQASVRWFLTWSYAQ
jgi:hypothetical protein